MAIAVQMPALSPTMKEGKITRWVKKEGDKFAGVAVVDGFGIEMAVAAPALALVGLREPPVEASAEPRRELWVRESQLPRVRRAPPETRNPAAAKGTGHDVDAAARHD